MALIIPPRVAAKIAAPDHGCITEKEVADCFANHCGGYCYDKRPQHLDSNGNPTPWFVAPTNQGRILKIMFVRDSSDIYLASAYPATDAVQQMFKRHAR
jgi:hypothetical protein